MTKPLIGVTSDIEYRDGTPRLAYYFLGEATATALVNAGALPVLLVHDLSSVELYLNRLDAIYISGGGYQFPYERLVDFADADGQPPEKVARAAFELELVRRAEERRLPIFGVCGGFQVMNVVAGGTIIPALKETRAEWRAHREPGIYDQAAHEVVMTRDSRLRDIVGVDRMMVNSLHSQGVVQAGPAARPAAWSPDGVLEAIERPDLPFWIGVQWHPEFHISPGDAKILEAFVAAAAHR